jgi:hypothetical protein
VFPRGDLGTSLPVRPFPPPSKKRMHCSMVDALVLAVWWRGGWHGETRRLHRWDVSYWNWATRGCIVVVSGVMCAGVLCDLVHGEEAGEGGGRWAITAA